MKHDSNAIAKAVATQIEKSFGHEVELKPYDESRSRSGDIHFSLPVSDDHGIFDMIIAESWLRISAGEVKNKDDTTQTSVQMALHYKHVGGGSNGSNIGTLWLDGNGEIIDFRAG